MSRLESRVFLDIEREFGFLKAIKFEDVVCRFPTCGRQAHKLHRHEHVASRDAVLHQNPWHNEYLTIFKRWITLSFCKQHQKQFHYMPSKPTQADVTRMMHINVWIVVAQLRRYYMADCGRECGVLGPCSGLVDDLRPDDTAILEMEKVMESYKKRFDPSCVSPVPNNLPRKPTCSFRASVVDSIREEDRKRGFIYLIHSKNILEEQEQIVKIGCSATKPQERVKNWGRNCNLLALENTPWLGSKIMEVQFAKRVESLVHAELRHYGHAMEIQCLGHGSKMRTHKEFFRISIPSAIATVQFWINWIAKEECEPYDTEGNFRAWTSLCSPNLTTKGDKNEFLLDSRGKAWYTHENDLNKAGTYNRCESWQTCRCPSPTIRVAEDTASRLNSLQEESFDQSANASLENKMPGQEGEIPHLHGSKSLAARWIGTPVRQPVTKPGGYSKTQDRLGSSPAPESPPPLSTSDCSTPFEDTAVTPRFDECDTFREDDSQDSFKSALSQPVLGELDEILDDNKRNRSGQKGLDRYGPVLYQDVSTTPTRHRKVSQTTLDRYGYLSPSPVPENRRRSIPGSGTVEHGTSGSTTLKTRASLGV